MSAEDGSRMESTTAGHLSRRTEKGYTRQDRGGRDCGQRQTTAVISSLPRRPVTGAAGVIKRVPVAQLDRASASEAEGYRFDPCRERLADASSPARRGGVRTDYLRAG